MFKHLKTRLIPCIGALLIVLIIPACNFTTAHISSFKVSTDKEGTKESTTFTPDDTFFARVEVSNVPSKVTLKWHLIAEKVTGQPDNAAITDLDRSFDLPSDGSSTYNLSPPAAGWPVGKYRIEVAMLTDSGEQKDQRSASITVAGTAKAPPPPPPVAPASAAEPPEKEATLQK